MTNCKSCGAEIIWGVTANGAKMPLSVASKENRWIFLALAEDRITLSPTYKPHFVDCPDAALHRKKV